MGIEQTRRANLRKLVADSCGPTLLAQRLGYRNPSFIVQMTGPSPIRDVSEQTARRIEASLGLPPLTLDREEQPAADSSLVVDVIRAVGSTLESENISLPPSRFADLVALAYLDATEHSNRTRADHIKALVRLLK